MKTRATFIRVLLAHLLLGALIFAHLAGVLVITAASSHGSISDLPLRSFIVDGLVFIAIIPCWILYRQERIAIVKWFTIALFAVVASQIVLDLLAMF